uniref:uncharacterized protein LOC122588683 n=1 Tax=Erigeron canadensis TaxID=72917 RepID=UPI001CB94583|nr:uncharacterized protein LOC122588683 [Erigeron canadensis]
MKSTDELLDTSIMFLEICSNTTEIISQTLQQIRDIGCGLRRNRGSSGIEDIIANYTVIRSKVKREVKGSGANLKQIEKMICSSPFMANSENDSLTSVFRAFKEITALSIFIFQLLLVYLAMPSLKIKSSKRHRWTRFISNGKVVPEEMAGTNVNELQHLDATLFRYGKSDNQEFIQVAPKKLEALEAILEGIGSHIHLISRRLIGTRASLLNIVSFY